MTKPRLYHLTAEWDLPAQAVLDALQEAGRRLKSHYVEIDTDEIIEIRGILEDAGLFDTGEEVPAEEAPVAPEAPPVTEVEPEAAAPAPTPQVEEPPAAVEPPATPATPAAPAAPAVATTPEPTPEPVKPAKPPEPEAPRRPEPPPPTWTAAAAREAGADRPVGVAKGFTGFAPGFDPSARRPRKREPEQGGGGPGLGTGPRTGPDAGPRGPAGPEMGGEDERGRRRAVAGPGGRTAVSPAKRGKQTTRRTGGQAQLGRGRRMERLMQEREHWYKTSRKPRKRIVNSANVVRPEKAEIQLPISLKELSGVLAIRMSEIMAFLMKQGVMLTQNQPVPKDAIELIGADYNIELEIQDEEDLEQQLLDIAEVEDDEADLVTRQPVVAVLGHVDHGKTSLLDRIRQTKSPVAAREAGGITQHIGAYEAEHDGRRITFIDTPGHEAFTEMRARGADVTDIVMLVIAADDGVMPQTQEAIQHAQAAKAHILVALNKIDKPNANKDKVLSQLTGIEGMLPREFGGSVDVIPCSATRGDGIDDILEHILFEAEAMELRANPNKPAWGTVLEAKKTTGRGVVATILVQDGTLRAGDTIIASRAAGKVRSLFNDAGKVVKEAGPGVPVEVLGLDEVPDAGERFYALEKTADIKAILAKREEDKRLGIDAGAVPTDEAGVWRRLADQTVKQVVVVVKADTQGTLQVLKREISKLGNDEVRCKVIRDGVGAITTADVTLAMAEKDAHVVVVGFGVAVDGKARIMAKEKNVDIRTHRVIYELLQDVKNVMAGALEPEEREHVLGQVEVRKVFKSSKLGNIAGCFVEQGVVRRNALVRLVRDGIVRWQGELSSLRRFKDDVTEVRENFECGIKLKGFDDLKEGDTLEVFEVQKIARTLD